MRVAFDLDDTLVPIGASFPTEPPPNLALRFVVGERLRTGAAQLLRDLVAEGHEVWVYTTSLRPAWQIRLLFRAYGVRLGGVVNHVVHDRQVSVGNDRPSKYPAAFGIDLLVDDSQGVAVEGERHGFRVLIVRPSQAGWTDDVRSACREWGGRHRTSGSS